MVEKWRRMNATDVYDLYESSENCLFQWPETEYSGTNENEGKKVRLGSGKYLWMCATSTLRENRL